MLTVNHAREIVSNYLHRKFGAKFGDSVIILDKNTIEKSYGWIFFYQHRRYLETGRTRDALIGNGPLLVDKNSGKVVVFGSSGSIDYWCSLYENGKIREDPDGTIHLRFREDVRDRLGTLNQKTQLPPAR